MPPKLPWGWERFKRHVIGIFHVYGRLHRPPLQNPCKVAASLTGMEWITFLVALWAWTMDGYDFHSGSLSVSHLAEYFCESRDTISQSITLTLLFCTVGAAAFGIVRDMYGRKWPMVVNLVIIAILQIGTVYASTWPAFLAVRALFGVMMGGIWGLSASMTLESMPAEARGLFSGVLQQGYALGYLLAAVFNLFIVPHSRFGWKALFYVGAALTGTVAIIRCFFPESKIYLENKAGRSGQKVSVRTKVKAFSKEGRVMLKQHWRRCIYASLMMTLFNFSSHGSQDMYPTYMQQGKGFTADEASYATIIAKVGCISFGRRATIIVVSLCGCCPTAGALTAGAFLLQFCVQGAWGVVPTHLSELSPPQFRATFPGITYQIGNLISSPAAQILSTTAELRLIFHEGKLRPDYAPLRSDGDGDPKLVRTTSCGPS
ncbi:MFS general substrate transporter [Mycena crocata]|nr:MFS general substrate transporter [Mycena crocata]